MGPFVSCQKGLVASYGERGQRYVRLRIRSWKLSRCSCPLSRLDRFQLFLVSKRCPNGQEHPFHRTEVTVDYEAAKAKEEAIARPRISDFDDPRTVRAFPSRISPSLEDLLLRQMQAFQPKASESFDPFVSIDCRRRAEIL